jgi:hypothetical protein
MIAIANPIKPPSLLGIERNTAYRCRKYHSGWIWIGDLERSEGTKLTGSADQSGLFNAKSHIPHKTLMLTRSLKRKRWVNFTFKLADTPPGTLLPLK